MSDPERTAAVAQQRQRLTLMLEAFERAEPDSARLWEMTREVLAKAHSLTALKRLAQEFRGMAGALSPSAQHALDRVLLERFGPEPGVAGDGAVVARVRKRGRIRTVREYRVVAAYADGLVRDPSDAASEAEYLQLGALLDAFMAGGHADQ